MPFDNPNQAPIGDLAILLDARDRIVEPSSWVQNKFKDGNRHCLVAALSLACNSSSFSAPNPTETRLARMLAKQLPPSAPLVVRIRVLPARQRLILFNDCRRICHHDVVALFDTAISQLAIQVPECA